MLDNNYGYRAKEKIVCSYQFAVQSHCCYRQLREYKNEIKNILSKALISKVLFSSANCQLFYCPLRPAPPKEYDLSAVLLWYISTGWIY